ncbi:MAG: argininosuccinate lyase [Planctomycetota bacterium]|nr:argininosuccinate lyase [Planctomycetota bacterium]MEE3297999.1 argininosuccinate lyase [Planctomycetota bacterium]
MMRSGRFEKGMADNMRSLNASIGFDKRFYREDIEASKAWARGLSRLGFLSEDELEQICSGLDLVAGEIESGSFTFSEELEDIHMNVEARLSELIGEAGAKLHTGRSRNDQVATDFRLYVKRAAEEAADAIGALMKAVVESAEACQDVVIPAYTHLQRAQPVLFSHHLLAYVEMLERDRRRFLWAAEQADSCPLGSGACVGNQFGIDREKLQEDLGFSSLTSNSLDGVSDRDFACDFLYSASMLMVHLSRFSEDIILWMTSEFGFVRLDDSVTSGSSMLPQKKNPDACELARGKTGRVVGHLIGLLTCLKGLPLSYNKDLQEDKEGVFDTHDTLLGILGVFTTMVETMQVDRERTAGSLEGGYLEALGVADYLTRKGVPFREAHDLAGSCVRRAEELKLSLPSLPLPEYRSIHEAFEEDLFEAISVEGSLADKDVPGGTAPSQVAAQLERWREALK